MRKKMMAILLGIGMLFNVLAACSNGSASNEAGGTAEKNGKQDQKTDKANAAVPLKFKVVLITMDSVDQHWVSVNKGAEKAAAELGGVDFKWMAPDKKDDAQQIERVNNAIADGANAIVIAANGPDAIVKSLEEAKKAGIKIIYVDSPANLEAEATFATNNEDGGKKAGEELLKVLEARKVTSGKIGIVNVNASTASTAAREKGFREALKNSGFEILETQYGEGDAAKSQDIADNYITDGCVGIFSTNEGATVGSGNAIKSDANKIVGVGFDKSDAILTLIREGSLAATMTQNPEKMGYEGVKAAVAALKGNTIKDKNIDTGVVVVTKENVDAIKK